MSTIGKEAGHTPTPWNIGGAVHIYAPGKDGGNICSMSEPRAKREVGYTPAELGSEEAYANAEFIVRAVNAHDELVAALEAAEYALGNAVKPECWRDFDDLKVWAEHWLPEARAALSRAKGEA